MAEDRIDDLAWDAAWYRANLGGDGVKRELEGKPDGHFLIRNSSTNPGNFTLSYALKGDLRNVHILNSPGGIHIKTEPTKKFSCLTDLVDSYCLDQGGLQCKLYLHVPAVLKPHLPTDERTLNKKELKALQKARKKAGPVREQIPGSQWTIQDVTDWLSQTGLKEYTAEFKKNKIDGSALLQLTNDDLMDLGIGVMGHRKKIMGGIEHLKEAVQKNLARPPGAPVPQQAIGLVARNIDGKVRIFDTDTGKEVFDISAHQKAKREQQAVVEEAANQPAAPFNGFQAEPVAPAFARRTSDSGPAAAAAADVQDHSSAVWYRKDFPKDQLNDLLLREPDGTFVVRDSARNPGSFAMSYVRQGAVSHKLIESTASGFRFKSSSGRFYDTLVALVHAYMEDAGTDLKCPLVMPSEQTTRRARTRERQISAGSTLSDDVVAAQRMASWTGATSSSDPPAWDCRHLGKDAALARLDGKPQGTFIIRSSDGCYAALSMVGTKGPYHMHIQQTSAGIHFKKHDVTNFPTLEELVEFYARPGQPHLPVALVL